MNQPPPQPASEAELVWQSFDRRKGGFFVEVGANEPKSGSQTWLLEQQGWRGILIEPQARLCQNLRAARPASTVLQVACSGPGHPKEMTLHIADAPSKSSLVKNLIEPTTIYTQTEIVKVMTLDAILAEAGNPRLDFVSIDVEGTQLDVLRGFDLQRHSPALLLIEDHLHHLSVHRYLRRHGYRLVKRTGLNNWYVPRQRQCTVSSPVERFRLWKKVWANTPFRKFRIYCERKRAARDQSKRRLAAEPPDRLPR